ncbi:MAG: histidine--tRNA ligase [Candidatus Micrarchaeota archaeon]|nr:histidine--tRNA ligase [Candidatus Micrarchaeota archaeon]
MKVKGMRDYLPEYQSKLNYLLDFVRQIYESYGYLPMDSPAMEDLDTLYKKSGEEIKNQIFKVEEKYGLRFDLTVPLARIVGENNFPKPFKRYAIGKVWRLEEPQKGRYREFYQADIDIVGCKSVEAEAELLSCVTTILNKLKIDYTIHVNDRRILNVLLDRFRFLNKEKAMRILDKIDKLEKEEVKNQLKNEGDAESLFEYLSEFSAIKEEQKQLEKIKEISLEVYEDLKQLKELCNSYGIAYKLDLFLVRGLAYYTGLVFEIKAKNFDFSIAGGGRYDNLLALYGKKDYATGISLGIDRILLILDQANFQFKTRKKIYVISDSMTYNECIKLATMLRTKNLIVELDLMKRNMTKQLEFADKLGYDYVFIFCEHEKKNNNLIIKNMKKNTQVKIDFGVSNYKLEEVLKYIETDD